MVCLWKAASSQPCFQHGLQVFYLRMDIEKKFLKLEMVRNSIARTVTGWVSGGAKPPRPPLDTVG